MNQKRLHPEGDEILTLEELVEINKARDALNAAELSARDAKEAWCRLLDEPTTEVDIVAPHRMASMFQAARRARVVAKAKTKEARAHYFAVSLPRRLRLQRAAKIVSDTIKDRLNETSFAEKIFPRAEVSLEVVTIQTIVKDSVRRYQGLAQLDHIQIVEEIYDEEQSGLARTALEARASEKLRENLNDEIFKMFEALVAMGYEPYGYVPITKARINPDRPPTLSITARTLLELLSGSSKHEALLRVMKATETTHA